MKYFPFPLISLKQRPYVQVTHNWREKWHLSNSGCRVWKARDVGFAAYVRESGKYFYDLVQHISKEEKNFDEVSIGE